jgi:hypothetical protein
MDVATDLVRLEKAMVLFGARLLAAFREGASMHEIETATGLPERLVNNLIVATTDAQKHPAGYPGIRAPGRMWGSPGPAYPALPSATGRGRGEAVLGAWLRYVFALGIAAP